MMLQKYGEMAEELEIGLAFAMVERGFGRRFKSGTGSRTCR